MPFFSDNLLNPTAIAHTCTGVGPSTEACWFTRGNTLNENPSSHQLPIVPQLGGGIMSPSLLHARALTGFILCLAQATIAALLCPDAQNILLYPTRP